MTQTAEHPDTQSFADALESSLNFRKPEEGELLKGTIVSIAGEEVFVSYGGPTEAVMASSELEGKEVGDTIEATVVGTTPVVRLSYKLAMKRASIQSLRQARDNGIPVVGKVGARNKGGFDVSVSGVRAFCPLSQIEFGKIENPDEYVGKTFDFRLIEMSDDGRKVVVSRTALLKEAQQAAAVEALKTLTTGAIVTGRVTRLAAFGAFVDLGGIEGLLHVSELSRRHVKSPKDVVSPGQEVTVKVIKMDESGKKISLSMKALEADPWLEIAQQHPAGSAFTGTVVRKTDFGLFVEVEPGVDGLVHVSQLPIGMKLGDDSLAIGTAITGWIREVDAERKRLSLALREVATSDPWQDVQTKYQSGRVFEGTLERIGPPGAFVQLEPGLTGLIPASEFGGGDASKLHKPGEKISVKVMNVDPARKRISLSHEGAKESALHGEYMEYVAETKKAADASEGKSAMALAFERAMGKK
ncbi:MAG: S1 RNA-binding domain-containing protein [Thermoanaerobaculia bacterium]